MTAVEYSKDLAGDRYAVARRALSTLPLSVVLVAAAEGGRRSCATGTAMYVSFSPPRLAVALHPGSRTTREVLASGEFSVSVLGADQHEVAVLAGRSVTGDDKFVALGLPVLTAPDGLQAPGLAGSPAVLWCRITRTFDAGDHAVVIGEVVAFDRSALDSPAGDRPSETADRTATTPALLRQHRRYAAMGPWLSDEAPEGYPT